LRGKPDEMLFDVHLPRGDLLEKTLNNFQLVSKNDVYDKRYKSQSFVFVK